MVSASIQVLKIPLSFYAFRLCFDSKPPPPPITIICGLHLLDDLVAMTRTFFADSLSTERLKVLNIKYMQAIHLQQRPENRENKSTLQKKTENIISELMQVNIRKEDFKVKHVLAMHDVNVNTGI
jgi:hypothetical protein